MHLHCQDDCDIKASRLLNDSLYLSSNRSAPNLLTVLPQHAAAGAFRSHLHHLLPRHAYFRARVQIHKVSNIPLVSGSFSVRWKLKNVHSAPGPKHKLLGMVKSRARPGTPVTQTEYPHNNIILKSKEDSPESDDSTNGTDASVPSVVVSSFGPGSWAQCSTARAETPVDAYSRHFAAAPISNSSSQTAVVPPNLSHDVMSSLTGFTSTVRPPLPNIMPPIQSSSQGPAPSVISPFSPGYDMPAVRVRTPTLTSLVTSKPGSIGQHDLTSAARGQTYAAELKDHAVVWNHTVNTVLRIDVSRNTGILAISPLKLIVIQQPSKNDVTGASQKARFGVLYLNLAEYADKGAVDRKFLLKESKSNAILKLTIELEHIGGTDDYVAPPLPQGEIMNGIASLLEKDLYYGGFRGTGKIRHAERESIPASRQVSQSSMLISEPSPVNQKSTFDPLIDSRFPFTTDGLPGAKSTEALIEALFNPAVTTDKGKESPFTVYVPQDELESSLGLDRLDANPRKHLLNLEVASMYSTASSSEDAWTTARTVSSHTSATHSDKTSDKSTGKSAKIRKLHLPLGSGHHEASGVEQPLDSSRSVKGWWKRRIASRPSTPTYA